MSTGAELPTIATPPSLDTIHSGIHADLTALKLGINVTAPKSFEDMSQHPFLEGDPVDEEDDSLFQAENKKEAVMKEQFAVLDAIEKQHGEVTEQQVQILLASSAELGMSVESSVRLVDVDGKHGGEFVTRETNKQTVAQQLKNYEVVEQANVDEKIWNDIFPTGDRAYQLLPRQAWIDFADTVRDIASSDLALKNSIKLIQKSAPESMFAAIAGADLLNDSGNGFDTEAVETWLANNLFAIETGDFSLAADTDTKERLAA